MAIQLKKGNSISLKKEAPKLNQIMLGLGWDMVTQPQKTGLFGFLESSAAEIDLDASVLCLDQSDRLTSTNNVIYYKNLSHPSNAIRHLGDNLTGQGDGDDERIIVELDQVPDDISTLLFVVNIYKGQKRKQNFSAIRNAFVRLVDLSTNQEIASYELSESAYTNQTLMKMAELRRTDSGWQMKAIGEGLQSTLDNLISDYQS